MNRKHFLYLTTVMMGIGRTLTGQGMPKPEIIYFKDDGLVPNNKYPLLLYKNAFSERGEAGAQWLEKSFFLITGVTRGATEFLLSSIIIVSLTKHWEFTAAKCWFY